MTAPGRAGASAGPPGPPPLRRFGQNHLIDDNVLQAIVRQAAVRPDDVVLEVGAAGGVLTAPLLARARVVHAVEVDRRFAGRLRELAAADPRLRVHEGDALRLDLTSLDPPPTTLVSNLAYSIAIPLVVATVTGLPTLRRWAVMVQKELAARLFAVPRTKAYAAVSVVVQLACVAEASRPVSRNAFRPRPRVDSRFLTFERRRRGADGGWHVDGERLDETDFAVLAALARRGFAQRRKLLAGLLAGAALAGRTLTREDVLQALVTTGRGARARAEELSPADWVRLAAALARGAAGSGGDVAEPPA